jgi:hypothetical protein
MEFLYFFIHLVLRLDDRSLRPLSYWVPDLEEVLRDPQRHLQTSEITIGPWTRYFRVIVFVLLLAVAANFVVVVAESVPVTICIVLTWLILSGWVIHAGRGGVCQLTAQGAAFRYRGVTVFCPWDLFLAHGQPIFYPGQNRLALPVQHEAVADMQVHTNDAISAEGVDAKASHFHILPGGDIWLKFVYGVNPVELGLFLLQLGCKLGRRKERSNLEAPSPSPAGNEAEGWIRVNLTQLGFGPLCCDCCQFTDRSQQFLAHKSMFSGDFSISGDACFVVIAPVCGDCQRVNRRQYWRTYFKIVLLTVIGGTTVGFLVGAILDFCGVMAAPGAMTSIMTCSSLVSTLGFSWFLAAKRAAFVCAPLHLSDYRPGEGTIQIRFRNKMYARLFQ